MELYTQTSAKISDDLLRAYSTSFGFSSLLFPKRVRSHIANVYGLVRIADEIVDTYRGTDSLEILDNLENETYKSIKRQYSANPVVHSFALSAKEFNIEKSLIKAFFESMRTDLTKTNYNKKSYEQYIYGSAEVIGLMCLAIFCEGNKSEYDRLSGGAKRLGAAYQKINFLRDLASDSGELGRIYFPNVDIENFTENSKNEIIENINEDLNAADIALSELPTEYRKAVYLSRLYYGKLLSKINKTPAEKLKVERIRLNNLYKIILFMRVLVGER